MRALESRVTRKGQVTLPAEIRAKLGIMPKDTVRFVPDADGVKVIPIRSILAAGFGAVKPVSQPEHWKAVREAFEEGVAASVMEEG